MTKITEPDPADDKEFIATSAAIATAVAGALPVWRSKQEQPEVDTLMNQAAAFPGLTAYFLLELASEQVLRKLNVRQLTDRKAVVALELGYTTASDKAVQALAVELLCGLLSQKDEAMERVTLKLIELTATDDRTLAELVFTLLDLITDPDLVANRELMQ